MDGLKHITEYIKPIDCRDVEESYILVDMFTHSNILQMLLLFFGV